MEDLPRTILLLTYAASFAVAATGRAAESPPGVVVAQHGESHGGHSIARNTVSLMSVPTT